MNPAFFAAVRRSLFGGTLSQPQVDGLNAVLGAFARHGDGDKRKLAYALATKFHEVGAAMVPKVENLNYTSAERIRKVWPSRFRTLANAEPYVRQPQKLANFVYGNRADLGNDQPDDGWRYRGRGDSQITGKGNYAKFSKLLGVDLVGNPDKVLEVDIAADILVLGLVRGLFTGKKLADWVPDFIAARATVNGDVAANGKKIAGYADMFLAALTEADLSAPAPKPRPTPKPAPAPSAEPAKRSPVAVVTAALIGLAGALYAILKSNGVLP
jgi:putative chitinase